MGMRQIVAIEVGEELLQPNYYGDRLPGVDEPASAERFSQLCQEAFRKLYPAATITVVVGGELSVTFDDGEQTDKWCYVLLLRDAIYKTNVFGRWLVLEERPLPVATEVG